MTRRRDAIYQAIQPGYHPEHVPIGGIAIAAGLARHLRRSIACLHRVAVGLGGAAGSMPWSASAGHGRAMHARRCSPSGARSISIKQVTVVDEDIDIADPLQVEWAVATRMKADRDLVVVPGVRADLVGTAGTGWAGRQARHRCHETRRGPRGLDKGRPARRGHGKGAASAGEWTDIRAEEGAARRLRSRHPRRPGFAGGGARDAYVGVDRGTHRCHRRGRPAAGRETVDARGRLSSRLIDGQVHAGSAEGFGGLEDLDAPGRGWVGSRLWSTCPMTSRSPWSIARPPRRKIEVLEAKAHVDVALYGWLLSRSMSAMIGRLADAGSRPSRSRPMRAIRSAFPGSPIPRWSAPFAPSPRPA